MIARGVSSVRTLSGPIDRGAGNTTKPAAAGPKPRKIRGWRSQTSNEGGLEFRADFEVAAVRVAVPAVVEAKTSDPWVHQHDPQPEAVVPNVLIQRLV